MKTYSIREVLQNIANMPDSWFYLPAAGWTLDTRGAFSLDSRDFAPDSTGYLPSQVFRLCMKCIPAKARHGENRRGSGVY